MRSEKPPLYRKENTTAHMSRHNDGKSYGNERNTRKSKDDKSARQSMHGKQKRGLDYTPLFKFLLSKVGKNWDSVYSEAVSRLDKPDPIFWLVALHEHEKKSCVLLGESSYYSGLFIDEQGCLQIVDPEIGPSSFSPSCRCCTHTFNGLPFTKPYAPL